ncbi:hypothetical protein COI93_09220 [Bacillus cereus]|uniref:Lipoprotein n=1 Tax=Bacillus cereus TaxID=1396 RepID=A0A2B0MS79_BACCE|nr:hypothetical protein COI93_09220 [Bacillus cereus]
MKRIIIFLLFLSVFTLSAGCNSTDSPQIDEILGIGISTTSHEVRFQHTTDKKKIKTISNIFNKKEWVVNKVKL